MGEIRHAYKISVGNLMGGDCLVDLGMDERIILKCILKK
jgi:hypothetical protein